MGGESVKRPAGDLLRAMATGGGEEFRDFVTDALPDLERTLRSLFRKHGVPADTIDDLVQDTILKAMETLRRNPSQDVSIGWLFLVARSVRVDRQRRERREAPADDGLLANVCAGESRADIAFDVRSLLDKLTPEHKQIILMCYYENMKF